LIVLNLILLMLVFLINVKVHAGTVIDVQIDQGHHCADARDAKKMTISVRWIDYTE
jgi:hypothetical protein